jgi:hypothetical protein
MLVGSQRVWERRSASKRNASVKLGRYGVKRERLTYGSRRWIDNHGKWDKLGGFYTRRREGWNREKTYKAVVSAYKWSRTADCSAQKGKDVVT